MYRPAPPRPKKTSIVRTRTGCRNCRIRRKKCDERRPACGACTRLGKHCDGYATKLEFRNVSFETIHSQDDREIIHNSSIVLQHIQSKDMANNSPSDGQSDHSTPTSLPSEDVSELYKANPILELASSQIILDPAYTYFDNDGAQSDQIQNADYHGSTAEEPSTLLPSVIQGSLIRKQSFDSNVRLHPLRLGLTVNPTKENFYISVWGNKCAPALHPTFDGLALSSNLSPVVEKTMMAIAARHLSRILPRAREHGSLDIVGTSFRPDLTQQSISGEFSSCAMQSVAKWTRENFERDTKTALAVLTLFCYLESLTSNFKGFYLHSDAVETLFKIQKGRGSQLDTHEAGLIAAWVQCRMHNWWRRFHFATPLFHRNHPVLTVQPTILSLLSMTESSRVTILMILCESYRLNAAAFMQVFKAASDLTSTTFCGATTNFNTFPPSPSHSNTFTNNHEEHLDRPRDALNDWHARILPHELPIDTIPCSKNQDLSWDSTGMRVEPIYFQSHEAAMNFAYYVTARIMQCTEFLNVFATSNTMQDISKTFDAIEPWTVLLLRIAAGIDWESCIRLNTYTIGLSGLLLDCVLRSKNLEIGIWVESWVNQRYHQGCLEEGSFPIFQILQVLRIINEERRSDRHVYAVCQPIDDGGGIGKYDSYNSQKLASVLVYGWCMSSKCLYSRRVDLGEFGTSYPLGGNALNTAL